MGHGWGMVGARLAQGWGTVKLITLNYLGQAWGMVGVWLGHGWGAVGARLGHKTEIFRAWLRQGWGTVEAREAPGVGFNTGFE